MSRSSSDPGNVTTPTRSCGLAIERDLVRLDERVREQLLAHPLDLGAHGGGIARLDLEVDDAADARVPHREAEVPERRLDRLSLRVEDALLRPDQNRCLHRSTASGSSRYSSNSTS